MTDAATTQRTAQPAGTPGPRRLHAALLILYVATLAWLTLFKLSYDIPTILAEHRTRGLNLVPFAGLGQGGTGLSEPLSNVVTLIPLGLLLAMNLKRNAWWQLTLVVIGFSVSVESLQYVLAIGATDATDIATNTLGGLTGVLLYRLADRGAHTKTLDRIILITGVILFVAFVLLRVLVLQVRY